MPQAGEDRRRVTDVFAGVYSHCIEFMAGRAAERTVIDGEPAVPVDDISQARELASLISFSEDATQTFIAHCDLAARDMLLPHADLVEALSSALRLQRTLSGDEIDQFIWDHEQRKSAAIEQRRRAMWKQAEIEAARFRAQMCSL